MFVQIIPFELLNLLLPNLAWWCTITSQIVFQKDWFAVFMVNVTVKANIIKIWFFSYIIWTADPFATKLGLMAHCHRMDCLVNRLDCSVVVKVKVTGKVQNSSKCSSGWNLLICLTVCSQLGMVMHHHGPECHARRLVCCLQVQGHSEGSFHQIWLFQPYLPNCWSFCNQIYLDGMSS